MGEDDKGERGNKLAKAGLEPTTPGEARELARDMAETRICGLQGPGDALLRIMTGRMLGFSSMQSIMEIRSIQGTPVISAKALVGLCLSHPSCEYFTLTESSDRVARYKVKRKGSDEVVMQYSIDDAQKAGLTSKDNWKKMPAAMLRARASAAAARAVFSDALMGMYASEEMGEGNPRDIEYETPKPPRLALKAAPTPPPSDVQPVDRAEERDHDDHDQREPHEPEEVEGEAVHDPANDLPRPKSVGEIVQHFLNAIDVATTVPSLESIYRNARDTRLGDDAMRPILRACSVRKAAIMGKAG